MAEIVLAQIDSRIGDLKGNLERIGAAHARAARLGAKLVVFPELVLTGYPPRDLLFDGEFREGVEGAVRLLTELEGPPLVVGAPVGRHNAAVVIHDGAIHAVAAKQFLARDDVFHEARWFEPGEETTVVELPGLPRFELLICEDLWRDARATDAELTIVINASPYRTGIGARRLAHARRRNRELYYCNAVGAQDELVFDGGSFHVHGERLTSLGRFEEEVDFPHRPPQEPPDAMRQALVMGIRGFFAKNGIRNATLGLSGGIDSAVVACLAAEALGPHRVQAVAIPSRFNDPRSLESARELADNLAIKLEVVPLEPLLEPAARLLATEGTAHENLQARLRMVVLMARVNQGGGLLLNTSNKTELTLGYGTLYGDLCGTLGPLNDVTKPEVYDLAALYPQIPAFIVERPPSAELSAGQVDPFDYPTLAPRLEKDVLAQRWRSETSHFEHKRRQGPIGLKVSEKGFGSGRFVPVTAKVVYPVRKI